MYSESNPDEDLELDPMTSGWGMNNPDPSTMDGMMAPLG